MELAIYYNCRKLNVHFTLVTLVFPESATRCAILFPWESTARNRAEGISSRQPCGWSWHTNVQWGLSFRH